MLYLLIYRQLSEDGAARGRTEYMVCGQVLVSAGEIFGEFNFN